MGYVNNGKEYTVIIYAFESVVKRIEKTETALTCLIPNAWLLFEVILFDLLDTDGSGEPNEDFGVDFDLIHEEITQSIGKNLLESTTMNDDLENDGVMKIELRNNKEVHTKYKIKKK